MQCIYSPFALIISAFLTGLAHHPLHLGPLAWFSLVPFIFVLNRITSLKHFIITGFIWGFIYYITVIFWLATNIGTTPLIGTISMIAAVLYCSLNIILICLLLSLLFGWELMPNLIIGVGALLLLYPFIWTCRRLKLTKWHIFCLTLCTSVAWVASP